MLGYSAAKVALLRTGWEGVRFGLSGLVNTAVYFVIGHALLGAGMGHSGTGAIAAMCAGATGFVLHRLFSFRSRNAGWGDAGRFSMLMALNTCLSSAALPTLATSLGLSNSVSLAVVACVIPAANFVVMKLYVFKRRDPVER